MNKGLFKKHIDRDSAKTICTITLENLEDIAGDIIELETSVKLNGKIKCKFEAGEIYTIIDPLSVKAAQHLEKAGKFKNLGSKDITQAVLHSLLGGCEFTYAQADDNTIAIEMYAIDWAHKMLD